MNEMEFSTMEIDPEKDNKSAVQIVLRECPAKELDEVLNIQRHGDNFYIDDRCFEFDKVMGPEVTQEQLYYSVVQPLVLKTLNGYHSTVLAYGQTGTGKSYTMGLQCDGSTKANTGMVPRALFEIFSADDEQSIISISFAEIYNEKIYDLLAANDNAASAIKLINCTKRKVSNLYEAQRVLQEGNKNRHVRPTKMNSNSSRSHAIFTIIIETKTFRSALNLVDLAGSEGVRRTGNQGAALTEGVNINKGLLSIGKVMQALSTGDRIIPYRDSILSFTLKDSLNLNSYLTLLACVSPLKVDGSETLATLRFAMSAKSSKYMPKINATSVVGDYRKYQTPNKSMFKTPLTPKQNFITPAKSQPRFTTSTVFGSKRKPSPMSSWRSNTFSTPNKKSKTDQHAKANNTAIGLTPIKDRPKISNCIDDSSISLRSRQSSFFNVSSSTTFEPASASNTNQTTMLNEMKQQMDVLVNEIKELKNKTIIDQNKGHSMLNNMANGWNRSSLPNVSSDQSINNCTVIQTRGSKKRNLHDVSWGTLKNEIQSIVSTAINDTMKPKAQEIQKEPDVTVIANPSTNSEFNPKEFLTSSFDLNPQINEPTCNAKLKLSFDNIEQFAIEKEINCAHNNSMNSSNDIIEIYSNSINSPSNIIDLQSNSINSPNYIIEKQSNKSPENETKNTSINYSPIPIIHRPARRSRRLLTMQSIDNWSNTLQSQNVPTRRSKRLASICVDSTDSFVFQKPKSINRPCRRSTRLPNVISIYKTVHNNEPKSNKPAPKKPVKRLQNVIEETLPSIKTGQTKEDAIAEHAKQVLKMFNIGSCKDLQMLPAIGPKTAYQIIVYRSLNGRFKDFDGVSKMPVWRGKGFERFKNANQIQ